MLVPWPTIPSPVPEREKGSSEVEPRDSAFDALSSFEEVADEFLFLGKVGLRPPRGVNLLLTFGVLLTDVPTDVPIRLKL